MSHWRQPCHLKLLHGMSINKMLGLSSPSPGHGSSTAQQCTALPLVLSIHANRVTVLLALQAHPPDPQHAGLPLSSWSAATPCLVATWTLLQLCILVQTRYSGIFNAVGYANGCMYMHANMYQENSVAGKKRNANELPQVQGRSVRLGMSLRPGQS